MTSIWRKYHGAIIPWKPPHKKVDLSMDVIRKNIKEKNSFFARWTSEFDSKKQSLFWYIINDKQIHINDYSVSTRSKINRGLKKLIAKKIDKSVLLNSGYGVYSKALKRYNIVLNNLTQTQFLNDLKSLDESWDFWGVFDKKNNQLVAFSLNRLVDDYCDYSTIKFDPEFLKNYSSYVLYYSMNKFYLNEKNFKYVNNGAKSISHQTNIHDFLIDKFKFRKAYCKMELIYSPIFKMLVKFAFPIRRFIKQIPLNSFRKLYVVLNQEYIKRLCDKIYNEKKNENTTLVLSNGNFKSGSTWVKAIINEICNYQIDSFPNSFQNPKHKNWIHRFKISDFLVSSSSKKRSLWVSKTHIFQKDIINSILIKQDNIKVINIDRDIKDVLVSHYHHLLNSKKINSSFNSYFNKWGKYKAKQCVDYNKAWKNYDCLKLKYSDLQNNNKSTILKISDYLGIKLSDDKIKYIQNETDIKNLRNTSKQKNLNEEDWFYRKGVIGDWKNYFDEEMIIKIKDIEANNLSVFEEVSYFIKFTFRLKLKYFLYNYFPYLYIKFDKFF